MISFFITPIVGAVIGYFTNWLAIKMLFRPHKQIKIFGIGIPFTPGLIPKERYKLAKKVANTVGTHLLTTEVLMNELTSDTTIEKINEAVESILSKISETNMSVEEGIKFFAKDSYEEVIVKGEAGVSAIISNFLMSDESITAITNFSTDKIKDFLMSPDIVNKAEPVLSVVKTFVMDNAERYSYDEKSNEFIEKSINELYDRFLLNDKPIAQYLPEKTLTSLKLWIQENIPLLGGLIQDFLLQNPSIDEKLGELVDKIINNNIGKIISMFINSESVYANIKEGLFSYLAEPDNQNELTERAWQALDEFIEKDISFLSSKFDKLSITQKLSGTVMEWLSVDFISKAFDFLTEQVQKADGIELYEMILKAEPMLDSKLNAFIKQGIIAYTDTADSMIQTITAHIFKRVLSIKLNTITENIGGLKQIQDKVIQLIRFLIEKGAVYVVEGMDIERMVEDKMNQFEVAEAETIILSVVNKELQLITIIGGVLGFIIGMLPQLLQLVEVWVG